MLIPFLILQLLQHFLQLSHVLKNCKFLRAVFRAGPAANTGCRLLFLRQILQSTDAPCAAHLCLIILLKQKRNVQLLRAVRAAVPAACSCDGNRGKLRPRRPFNRLLLLFGKRSFPGERMDIVLDLLPGRHTA